MHEICSGVRPETVQSGVCLANYSTLGIGGEARYFSVVTNQKELVTLQGWAQVEQIPVLIVGEGSNFLFPDEGFPGLVLKILIYGIEREDDEVVVGAGENLGSLIEWLNQQDLQGLERMYGIPGSLAGAVVGNAGAYGQDICQVLSSVVVLQNDGTVEMLSVERLHFQYRHSLFKENRKLVLLYCQLCLTPSLGTVSLQKISDSILEKRLKKYPHDLKCPGSFFKNVQSDDLEHHVLKKIPDDFIIHEKISAGHLLESVGANGAIRGGAMVASYHGNLIVNNGNATAQDVLWLARKYSGRVLEEYGIQLEPEIRILDDF